MTESVKFRFSLFLILLRHNITAILTIIEGRLQFSQQVDAFHNKLWTASEGLTHGLTFFSPAVHCKAFKGAVGPGPDKNAQERKKERKKKRFSTPYAYA